MLDITPRGMTGGLVMKSLAIFAATCLFLCSTSASAAQPNTLGCVGISIGRDTMRVLGENALRRNDRESVPSVDRELDAVARAADLCRRRYGWSEAAATLAGLWTLTSARLDAASEALQRDGVSPMRAGEMVGRLSFSERMAMLQEPLSQPILNRLRGYAVDLGLPTQGVAANHLVWFTIMLIQEDRERSRFAQL